MISRKVIAAALSAAIILSAAGCGKKEITKELASSAVNVTIHTAGEEHLQNTVTYTGELKASDSTSTTSKISAKIVKINVEEGDYVKAGDILAELDSTDVQNAYNSALAGYNSALASYNSVVNSATKQAEVNAKNALNSAQLAYDQALKNYNREQDLYDGGSSLKLAKQNYDDAVAAFEREKDMYNNDTTLVSSRNNLATAEKSLSDMQALYEAGAVSKFDYDNAATTVENLRANLDALLSQKQATYDAAYSAMVRAEENYKTTQLNERTALDAAESAFNNAASSLNTAKENVELTQVSNKSSIATASASLESARNSLNTASENLNNTKIRALSSGYVASKNATIGQMAAAGAELFSIRNTNALMAKIEVTESVIPYVKQGTKAVVNVQSANIKDIHGVVSLVNPTKNDKTGMYTVQVDIDNPNGKLNVGMFADVSLTIEESNDALTVPNEAIMQSGEESFLYIASEDGKTAEKVLITTGIESGEQTQILTGLKAGDKVIVTGQDYLSEENNEINIVTE